jgi:hypothetical protein
MLLTPATSPFAPNQPSVTAFNAMLPVGPSTTAVVPSLASRDAAFVSLAQAPLQRASEFLRSGTITSLLDSLTPVADLMWTTASVFGGQNPLDSLTLLTPMSSQSVRSDGSAMGLQKGTLAGEDSEASAAGMNIFSLEG